MKLNLKNARFIQGAEKVKAFPKSSLDEIAIVGRSNVGKSTFLNKLANNSQLSRTSNTPGRTQEINFFEFLFKTAAKDLKLIIADLPGFGFAKFSKEKREQLSRLTVEYINKRKQLQLVCLLNDCRRDPKEDELAIKDLTFNSGKHCLVIMTKCDKLAQGELQKRRKEISALYGLEPDDLLLSSKKLDPSLFWQRIQRIFS